MSNTKSKIHLREWRSTGHGMYEVPACWGEWKQVMYEIAPKPIAFVTDKLHDISCEKCLTLLYGKACD